MFGICEKQLFFFQFNVKVMINWIREITTCRLRFIIPSGNRKLTPIYIYTNTQFFDQIFCKILLINNYTPLMYMHKKCVLIFETVRQRKYWNFLNMWDKALVKKSIASVILMRNYQPVPKIINRKLSYFW